MNVDQVEALRKARMAWAGDRGATQQKEYAAFTAGFRAAVAFCDQRQDGGDCPIHGFYASTVCPACAEHGTVSADAASPPPEADDQTPPELLAGRLIDAWCDAHGKPMPWNKAIQIVAILTKMPQAEVERLLALGDEASSDAEWDWLLDHLSRTLSSENMDRAHALLRSKK